MAETTSPTETRKPHHKELIGTVVSSKMQKTIVVEVTRKKAHPMYGRVISIRKKFYAHDEKNETHAGDVVKIEKIAPESSTVEFNEVLAVSGEPGTLAVPAAAKVTAEVVRDGRGDKILVFHLKRKKQYKKMQGHRQSFTEVRIQAIEADGVTYTAAAAN